jgi:hypothetical protein
MGETAIWAFVDRAAHPAGTFQDDDKVMRAFEEANSRVITKLHRGGELRSIAWVQLIPDTADRRPREPCYGASRVRSSACGLT